MKKKFFIFICSLQLIFFAIYILVSFSCFISENPFSPPKNIKKALFKIAPQGWGFFTRDPREKVSLIFTVNSNKSLELSVQPNGASNNLFGLSRKNRRGHLEFMRLLGRIPETAWKIYNEEGIKLPEEYNIVELNSEKYDYYFFRTGIYLVVKYDKTPWAYLENNIKFNSKKEFVVINFMENP